MKALKEFDISFVGLKEGNHQFEYDIDKKFFENFQYDDFFDCKVKITLEFLKKSTMFELDFKVTGYVTVACDLTNEHFDQEIEANLPLIVKFGEVYNEESEEILILPHSDYKINIAQYIYEMIVLAVPSKRIHPGIGDGSLESDVLVKLEELELKEFKEEKETIDPRWDKLKNIIIDKNTDNGTSKEKDI